MRLKPKVLVDISKKHKEGPYSEIPSRLNLSWNSENKKKLPKLPAKIILAVFTIFITAFSGFVFAPTSNLNAQTARTPTERAVLKEELADLERQIAEYERTVRGYRQRGATLREEINRLNAQINRLNLQVRATTLSLSQLDAEIGVATTQINKTESEIEQNKESISAVLRDIKRNENQNLVEILLANPSLSDFFGNVNNILIIQNSLSEALRKLQGLHEDYTNQKEQLGLQRADAATLKAHQEEQRREARDLRENRDQVLTATRGREAEYQNLLTRTRQTASQIRARLFHLLGGGAMTFAEAYEHALVAEQATGIRAALLLAILDRESALGRNVGRCNYQTAMHPRRDIPAFYEIIAELGMKEDLAAGRIKVSCPIVADGAFGGAMGPAQFIPSTWIAYRNRISKITGVRPANPWNNRDSFIGASLHFRDSYNSASCRNYASANRHVLSEQTLRERCAAAQYYAGRSWHRFRFTYGQRVLDRATSFEDDIAVLNANRASR